jgi:hypothetical protein
MPLVKRAGIAGAVVMIAATMAAAPAEAATPHRFKNCDALHKVFPHGVGMKGAHDHTSGTPVTNFARKPLWYKKNTASDRDKDGIACESA